MAFDEFQKDPFFFDLILTDMTMPGMTGYELAKKVPIVKPYQRIILCTGHSEEVDKDKVLATGIRAFLTKPMIPQKLIAMIRNVLNDKELNG